MLLNRWRPMPADTEQHPKPETAEPGPDAMLVDCGAELADLHALARAARRARIDATLFETHAEHEGKAWYDQLPRITEIAVQWRTDGRWRNQRCHMPPATRIDGCRPEVLRIELTVPEQGQKLPKWLFLPTDIAVANGDEQWPENGILLAADADLSPEELADFLADACHTPAEPSPETDSRRRQREEFTDRHFAFACRLLLPPGEAAKRTLAHLAQRHLANEALSIAPFRKVTITLTPGAPATAEVEPFP